jgi:DNA-binding MurR/RpiR family transcriptional regulator
MICITNSIGSPLAQAADIPLYAAPSAVKYFQARFASRVTQLALADVLLALIGQRRKRQALSHIQRAEEFLLKHRMPSTVVSGAPRQRQRSQTTKQTKRSS